MGANLERVLHARAVDEVRELSKAISAKRVLILRQVSGFKSHNKVLNYVVTMDVRC